MKIRKFQEKDRNSLIELWQRVFPDDPPHNEPSKVIESKLAIDDLMMYLAIFVLWPRITVMQQIIFL